MLILMFVAGCAVASALWWLYVRGLHGTISDLTDAKNDLQNGIGAAKNVVKG